MQVVVTQSSLSAGGDVIVVGSYNDNVDPSVLKQPGTVVLSLSPSSIEYGSIGGKLTKNWRDTDKSMIVFAEAKRRIDDVFPEYSQRNSTHELESYILAHGTDPAKWPAAVQARKAEIDRCWAYVDAVRAKSNNLIGSALPADPTADSQWPSRITPYTPAS